MRQQDGYQRPAFRVAWEGGAEVERVCEKERFPSSSWFPSSRVISTAATSAGDSVCSWTDVSEAVQPTEAEEQAASALEDLTLREREASRLLGPSHPEVMKARRHVQELRQSQRVILHRAAEERHERRVREEVDAATAQAEADWCATDLESLTRATRHAAEELGPAHRVVQEGKSALLQLHKYLAAAQRAENEAHYADALRDIHNHGNQEPPRLTRGVRERRSESDAHSRASSAR
eukprot:TRINITY_DN11044_c0_g1_i2.p1 TRINITY_DN11044_c0_g1~~TRINITY_DN11044_c0_g1_i2.p1  ORF type:complete len:235 (-),score=46.95 TRINITY_DN11044_c0_g1_i2:509-1213(-)